MSLPSPCRCGHSMLFHERVTGTHGWVCFSAPAEGAKACTCEACSSEGAPPQCACRRYQAVKRLAGVSVPAEVEALAEKVGAP